jgi:uncharacterized membrane protein
MDSLPVRPARNDALDLLRGIVMVVMALDHDHRAFRRSQRP